MKRIIWIAALLGILASCTVGIVYYLYYVQPGIELQRFRQIVARDDTQRWLRAEADIITRGVRSGTILVEPDGISQLAVGVPAVPSLGTAIVHCEVPWKRIGIPDGNITIYQFQETAAGGWKREYRFVTDQRIAAVFFGDPRRFGVVVDTSERMPDAVKAKIGSPFVEWRGKYGIWVWPGHPRK